MADTHLIDRQSHILVIDDQQEICDLVREYLSRDGFRVGTANDGAGMREAIARDAIDLVILDLGLEAEDGLELARELRSRSDIGIVMLTARGETADRIIGLEMGADDYLPKPFNLRELRARVHSVLRRSAARSAKPGVARRRIKFAGWLLDLESRQLTSPAGEDVSLSAGEFELLSTFVAHANQVMSRDRLLDLTRHREAGVFDRTIDVLVGRLRRKLDDDPKNPTAIQTVRNGGYVFTALVESG